MHFLLPLSCLTFTPSAESDTHLLVTLSLTLAWEFPGLFHTDQSGSLISKMQQARTMSPALFYFLGSFSWSMIFLPSVCHLWVQTSSRRSLWKCAFQRELYCLNTVICPLLQSKWVNSGSAAQTVGESVLQWLADFLVSLFQDLPLLFHHLSQACEVFSNPAVLEAVYWDCFFGNLICHDAQNGIPADSLNPSLFY